jgi:organic radical activating enzyme
MGKRHGVRDIRAGITEVFSSVQGEGIFAGERQIFIRFAKCNLDCDYCDTAKGGGAAYSTEALLSRLDRVNARDKTGTISITGGEPLLQADFLRRFLPELKKRDFKVYLETNGTLVGELRKVLGLVDTVAMDIKLPSSQGGRRLWKNHREFLGAARRTGKKNVFVKAVVTDQTPAAEIKKTAQIIKDIDPAIPLVLQPVTPAKRVSGKISAERLLEFQALAKLFLSDVRIIPQMHKMLGVQ